MANLDRKGSSGSLVHHRGRWENGVNPLYRMLIHLDVLVEMRLLLAPDTLFSSGRGHSLQDHILDRLEPGVSAL